MLATILAWMAIAPSASAQSAPRFVERQRFHAGGGAVEAIAFATSDPAFATAGGSQVALWEPSRGTEPTRFEVLGDTQLAFDPRGRYLASSGARLAVWDRRERRSVPVPLACGPTAWKPDGSCLAIFVPSRRIVLLAREGFAEIRSIPLTSERDDVVALLWEADGTALRFATGGRASKVFRWQIDRSSFDGDATREIGFHVRELAWLDGELAAFGARGELRVGERDVKGYRFLGTAAVTRDGTLCAILGAGGLLIGDANGFAPFDRAPALEVLSMAFDAEDRLAVGTKDGRVVLDVLGVASERRMLDARPPSYSPSVAFTPDERFALSANEARLAVLEIATGALAEIPQGGPVCAGRAGSEALIANLGGIEAWDVAKRERVQHWPRSWKRFERPESISLSPDRRTCITGHSTGFGLRQKHTDLLSERADGESRAFGLVDVAWSRDGRAGAAVFHDTIHGSLIGAGGRLELFVDGSEIRSDGDAMWPRALSACFAADGTFVWSRRVWQESPGGLFRRRWPDGPIERICDRSFLRLRAIGSTELLGIDRDGLHLLSAADGALLATWSGALQQPLFARYEFEVSRSGRWVAVRSVSETVLLEIVR